MNEELKIIDVTVGNLDHEHICCALSDKKCQPGVRAKKKWLADRMKEGLKFKKYNVNHKVFIEYLPAEYAWAPIEAPNHIFINCLWVAGKYKGHGYGTNLLNECIRECKEAGKEGIVAIAANKKRPFLPDAAFLQRKGFEVVDTAPPYFQLLRLSCTDVIDHPPRFKENAKRGQVDEQGLLVTYTHQCPFTEHYIKQVQHVSKAKGIPVKTRQLVTHAEAINSNAPTTTHSIFYNGKFVSHEMLNEKQFESLLKSS